MLIIINVIVNIEHCYQWRKLHSQTNMCPRPYHEHLLKHTDVKHELNTQNEHVVSYKHSAQRIQLNGKISEQERSPHLRNIMRLAT